MKKENGELIVLDPKNKTGHVVRNKYELMEKQRAIFLSGGCFTGGFNDDNTEFLCSLRTNYTKPTKTM